MKLTKKCQYGLRAVFELARRHPDAPVKIPQIAEAQGISRRFLEIILNELRHAGLVQSERGNEGGYSLARDPGEISLADVIEVIQGPISVMDVDAGRAHNYTAGDFAFGQLWTTANESMREMFGSMTYAELVQVERQNAYTSAPDYVI